MNGCRLAIASRRLPVEEQVLVAFYAQKEIVGQFVDD